MLRGVEVVTIFFCSNAPAAHLNDWHPATTVVDKSDTVPVMKAESEILYTASKNGSKLKAYEISSGSNSHHKRLNNLLREVT